MNETLMTLETRRSCRKFKPDMITDEELEAVLRAGTFAPSGKNQQSSIIIAVTNKEVRDQIAEENRKIGGWEEGFDPFYGAPVILIVIADRDANNASGTYINDGSLVMGNLMNAAASIGLGSVWIHRARQEFDSEFGKALLEKLGIKGNYEGIGHVALGYRQTPEPKALARKENYVYYIK
ncbi:MULTISPECIES: nitroreductase [unclassified Fibrobacter]|uniref:nitroreductase n=1 Tax=unclassified Fibrobacter TaxID=2634177 RepID=UPI000D6BA723